MNVQEDLPPKLMITRSAAGGITHLLTQTNTYKSYIFPAGTILFANTRAIHHAPTAGAE
ncbi:hypothetical protein BJX70DRAFT_395261 [Aspergillus crustosus]